MSLSVIAPAALRITLTRTSSCGSLASASHERPDRTLDVGLDDQVELGDLVALGLRHQLLEGRRAASTTISAARTFGLALLRRRGAPRARPRPRGCRRPRRGSPTSRAPGPACWARPASPAARSRRASRGSSPTSARRRPCRRRRACRAGRARSPPGRGPCRGAPRARRRERGRPGRALQLLEIGHQQDRVEQLVEVGARLGARRRRTRPSPPHSVGHEPVLHQLLANAGGVGLRLVDLVDRDDDRHARRLRVVDRLDRLRHHPVVGRDHQDHDVGHLRAAGRIAVNASWPGVSMKVTSRPFVCTW